MFVGAPLFNRAHLSDYFHAQNSALKGFVEKLMANLASVEDEPALVESILEKARVAPLVIEFASVSKDVQSTKLKQSDYSGQIDVDGVLATRSYPFTGERELFDMRPSTSTSVLPYGRVLGGAVTVGVVGLNDPEELKRRLDQQTEWLKQYVEWQRPEVEAHNQSLVAKVQGIVAARRKHLHDVARLKDLL